MGVVLFGLRKTSKLSHIRMYEIRGSSVKEGFVGLTLNDMKLSDCLRPKYTASTYNTHIYKTVISVYCLVSSRPVRKLS
jgi:hypothetical protein